MTDLNVEKIISLPIGEGFVFDEDFVPTIWISYL